MNLINSWEGGFTSASILGGVFYPFLRGCAIFFYIYKIENELLESEQAVPTTPHFKQLLAALLQAILPFFQPPIFQDDPVDPCLPNPGGKVQII
jgi:hypothetical protein